jgi:type IV secretion system protein VirD4
MANMDRKSKLSKKIAPLVFILILDLLITPIIAFSVNAIMVHTFEASTIIIKAFNNPWTIYATVFTTKKILNLVLMLQGIVLLAAYNILLSTKVNLNDTTETIKVANFEIPKPVGKGQMGTSRFTTEEEKEKMFAAWNEGEKLNTGGMIMGSKVVKGVRKYYFDGEDVNTLIIGTTRSGKSRREYLPSIYLLANSGENIFINDPKGELYIYTRPYLESIGYKVLNIDFRYPQKSLKYNYLRYIVEQIKSGNNDNAVEMVWDIVSLLVGEAKGEKLWNDGQASVLASAILYICFEAPEEKYKNLTNVYYFIANMCKTDEEGHMPITNIMNALPVTHPSRGAFAVAEIAPEKTRGSFFTSALATLRLFIDTKIADMTSTSENESENVDINVLGTEKKVALFCTIPDEKKTRHILATLLLDQLYMNLVDIANKNGGRLPTRVNNLIDEFGNLPKIHGFDNKLTVSLGRGIRWFLAIQGIGQLYAIYEKDIAEIITSNCHDWIYLLTTDEKQAEIISKKTGTYTVQTQSVSSSTSMNGMKVNNNVNYSSSANVTKRNLLTADEIARLQPPYSLVLKGREYPSIFDLPDISELKANTLFGMGSKEHNIELTKEREAQRPVRAIKEAEIWLPMLEELIEKDIDNSNELENINDINFTDENADENNELNFIG